MEITTQPMTDDDVFAMEGYLYKSRRTLKKAALYLFGLAAVILFIPAEILKFFSRRRAGSQISGMLFDDLGALNTLLFIVVPILLILFWIYRIGVHKLTMDLKNGMKETGIINVVSIEQLSEQTKKDLFGAADHLIKFEKNSFNIDQTYFLQRAQPELMHAKKYRVEVSAISKTELKRELVSE
jgi:ABC-type multidrug transport system fused ATPase/permease subunit